MNILQIKSPKWANAEQTLVNVEVNFEHLPEEFVWFTASPNDTTSYGKDIYSRAVAGEFGAIQAFVAPTVSYSDIIITARQFFIALANSGHVTSQEALAAAQTGAIPANIAAVFANLPAEQSVGAAITWAKMTTISRSDPLVDIVATALNLSSTETDNFFLSASNI